MAAAAEVFEEALSKLQEQHQQFLRQFADTAFEALKEENLRLAKELAAAKGHLARRPGGPARGRPATRAPGASQQDPTDGGREVLKVEPTGAWEGHGGTVPPGRGHEGGLADLRFLGLPCLPYGAVASGASPRSPQAPTQGPWEPLGAPDVLLPNSPDDSVTLVPATSPSASRRTGWKSEEHEVTRVSYTAMLSERDTPWGMGIAPSDNAGLRDSFSHNWRRQEELRRSCSAASLSSFRVHGETDWLHDKLKQKERRRLRDLLGVDNYTDTVGVEALYCALQTRSIHFNLSRHTVKAVMLEFLSILRKMPTWEGWLEVKDSDAIEQLPFDALAYVVALPNLMELVDAEMCSEVQTVVNTLHLTTVNEVIEEATRCANESDTVPEAMASPTWESRMGTLVSIVTIINVISMGVSVDHSPDHPAWFALETFCTAVFILEVLIKLRAWGLSEYFTGDSMWWNLLDFLATVISCLETSITVAVDKFEDGNRADSSQVATAARVIIILKILRMVRLVRLMIVQSMVLRDLAKMLVGFVIGIPSLLWVVVLFLFVLYSIGLTFRLCFGPSDGQNLRAMCGDGDTLPITESDPECPLHWIYGEEYFGTLSRSMFTTFRFMIGDTFTSSGRSLSAVMSAGYGLRFDILYVSFMIVVQFGLFNIITAIFVESTTSGIKDNDIKRKYARQYERKYVKLKLKQLISRIQQLCRELSETEMGRAGGRRRLSHQVVSEHDFGLVQEDFVHIMEDSLVRHLLKELDVEIYNADHLFDTFDAGGDGIVTMHNLVQAVMKLRGTPQKNDVIASWVTIRALHEKFEAYQRKFFQAQARLEANQGAILHVLVPEQDGKDSRPPSHVSRPTSRVLQ